MKGLNEVVKPPPSDGCYYFTSILINYEGREGLNKANRVIKCHRSL